jgi:serine/threonine protein kinase
MISSSLASSSSSSSSSSTTAAMILTENDQKSNNRKRPSRTNDSEKHQDTDENTDENTNENTDENSVELIEEMIWADTSDKFSFPELAIRPRFRSPDPCGCVGSGLICTDESCVLFACQEECYECLETCCNQRLTKKQNKQVQIINAGPKGKGLIALERIQKGQFILEYVGRAIRKQYLERLFSKYQHERRLYIMALDNDTYIDARHQGGIARYINHSCNPNCIVHRWKVRGVLRAGIFALRDISPQEELSFDYQWVRKRGRAPTQCYCASRQCRGTIELPKSLEEEKLDSQLIMHWKKPSSKSSNGAEIVNRTIRVYSQEHGDYFAADVCQYDSTTKKHFLMYRNNLEFEWVDLASNHEWQILDDDAKSIYIIGKKPKRSDMNKDGCPRSLIETTQELQPISKEAITNYFYVSTEVKNELVARGFINTVGVRFACSIDMERILLHECSVPLETLQIQNPNDGLAWKLTVSGLDLEKACQFLEKNITKIRMSHHPIATSSITPSSAAGTVSSASTLSTTITTAATSSGTAISSLQSSSQKKISSTTSANNLSLLQEEVIIPRCTVDYVYRKLSSIRDRCRSVNIIFAASESKSKQFSRIQLEATLLSDLQTAKDALWSLLQKACEELQAPKSSSGFYKDLGFYGGELSSEAFRRLVNTNADQRHLSLHQEANENLRISSFFTSFESTQRCTVWVQSEDDVGRIDASSNRIIAEFNPNAPRKIYFGCDPGNVPNLWKLVEQRAKEQMQGLQFVPLGQNRHYQTLLMKNGGKLFEYVHQVTGASVTVDLMTGDHLRIDGGNQIWVVGDWDSEQTLRPTDRALLAEEFIRLQIELFRDHCIRQRHWIFGRDWSLASITSKHQQQQQQQQQLQHQGIEKISEVTSFKSIRPSLNKSNRFDQRAIANGCLEIADIVSKASIVASVGAHAVIILYRFLKLVGDHESICFGLKLREVLMACLFLANKAQKVYKWKKLDALLTSAYPVFFPGTKYNREEQEAINFERKIILAETEILKLLDYDVFWKGVDWVIRAVEESGNVSSPMARNTLDILLSGPVLAAGPDLWLRYGVEYIFTAVAGFLGIQIEPLFQSLSLIPVKVSQAAQIVADSVEMNGNSRKSTRSIFNGGTEAFLSNLDTIKRVCMTFMANNSFRSVREDAKSRDMYRRHQQIGELDNQRRTFHKVPTSLLRQAVIPNIDVLSAESKCRIFVAANGEPNYEDIILEGSWRALAICEFLLKSACQQVDESLPSPVDSLYVDPTFDINSKTHCGCLAMDDICTAEGWEGTIQSKSVMGDATIVGRKVGGKACEAGRIREVQLRNSGLRWWIPPKYAPSPTGSLYEMMCVRNPAPMDDECLSNLMEVAQLGLSLLGNEKLSLEFPKLASFVSKQPPTKNDDRFIAVSMQRWPPEKIEKREQGQNMNDKYSPTGFSAAALQELQLLIQLHTLIPSPTGHPNFTLPIAVALPQAPEELANEAKNSQEYGETKVDDIFSLFRSSEENERSARKEKKRRDRASGPHIVFDPIPFIFTRIIQRISKMRRQDSGESFTVSPALITAWFHDLLSALVHCHTNDVILRAAQTDQIFVDHSGVLKLAGFYRATVLPENERDVYVNPLKNTKQRRDKNDDTDDSLATSPYSAPELLMGSWKHTKETDIWGIGSMLSHLLLGKPLFLGKERSSLLLAMYKIVGTPGKLNFPEAAKFPNAVKAPKRYKRGVEKAFQRMLPENVYAQQKQLIVLIAKMLHLDPRQRITAIDALKYVEEYYYHSDGIRSLTFRDQYVKDWMSIKKELQQSHKNDVDHDDMQMITERNLKRRLMLQAASSNTFAAPGASAAPLSTSIRKSSSSTFIANANYGDLEQDDLYNMDDDFEPNPSSSKGKKYKLGVD